jgi:hypothetical protein
LFRSGNSISGIGFSAYRPSISKPKQKEKEEGKQKRKG